MIFIALDLGTTNIKVAAYREDLLRLAVEQCQVCYKYAGPKVEFDPEVYFDRVFDMVCRAAERAVSAGCREGIHIVLTGQAESIILLGKDGKPLCPGFSWMDMRATEECHILRERFGEMESFRITGEPAISPAWPAAKILWVKRHRPELYSGIRYVLLLKDYIQYRLTGLIAGEISIRGFTYLFDINRMAYWKEMLDVCGICEDQLPKVVPGGEILGEVLPELVRRIPGCSRAVVNTGLLDHFAGAIGQGITGPGVMAESAGTVLSLTSYVEKPDYRLAASFHCGLDKDSYMLFSCCDNGGICYDWFKKGFLQGLDFADIEKQAGERQVQADLLFFPYLTGTNAPDFQISERGLFSGFSLRHDRIDFARAVLEGAGYLLRRNLEAFQSNGIRVEKLISSGGGAASPLWCQIKADICNIPVEVPKEEAMVCRGAAMMGLVTEGVYPTLQAAGSFRPLEMVCYQPGTCGIYEEKYDRFARTLVFLENGL